MHKGIDLAVPVATPVMACMDGTVQNCGYSDSYGYFMKVDGSEYSYLYAHLDELKVEQGENVTQGSVVALSGNTGQSTGAHLHFELYKGDELIDPEFIFQ